MFVWGGVVKKYSAEDPQEPCVLILMQSSTFLVKSGVVGPWTVGSFLEEGEKISSLLQAHPKVHPNFWKLFRAPKTLNRSNVSPHCIGEAAGVGNWTG